MMELTTTIVTRALDAVYPEVNWFVNYVPETEQTVPALPVGRVVEVGMTHDNYASDRPMSMDTTIQVDVWLKTLGEAEAMYYAMDELFMNNKASLVYSEISNDPDLANCTRVIKRYYIRRDIELG